MKDTELAENWDRQGMIYILIFLNTYQFDRILWSSIWEIFRVFLGHHARFCPYSYIWTESLRLIFDVFIHPISQVNRTARVIAMFGVRLFRPFGLHKFFT